MANCIFEEMTKCFANKRCIKLTTVVVPIFFLNLPSSPWIGDSASALCKANSSGN